LYQRSPQPPPLVRSSHPVMFLGYSVYTTVSPNFNPTPSLVSQLFPVDLRDIFIPQQFVGSFCVWPALNYWCDFALTPRSLHRPSELPRGIPSFLHRGSPIFSNHAVSLFFPSVFPCGPRYPTLDGTAFLPPPLRNLPI